MTKRSRGQSEQKITTKRIKAARKVKEEASATAAEALNDLNRLFSQNDNSQEKIQMTKTGEDPWQGQLTDHTGKSPLTSNKGRNRQEQTYPPALPPSQETIDITPSQSSKKTGAITEQEMKDYVAKANPQNINDVMKLTATFLASQDPERVIATAKAAMSESKVKTPKQTGSFISKIISFCCLYLGHLAAFIFLAFISGSTDMIQLMLSAPFLILLFIGELILCKRLTTNNE